jgi:hypothetical protein
MKAYGGVDVQIHVLLTLTRVGGEWSASRPCRFIPEERDSAKQLDRSLDGPQCRSRRYGKAKILYPTGSRTPTPLVVHPVAHFTVTDSNYSLYPLFPDSHTRFSPFYHGGVLQSTPLPALASQHTICWLYLNVCIQIANKLGNLKKKNSSVKI